MRRAAAARGLNEAVTWSFLPEADAAAFAARDADLWVLANPISEDMKAMRPSLLPGLLSAARRNLDRGAPSLRLFEIGRRYLRGEAGLSDERVTLGDRARGRESPARVEYRQGNRIRRLRCQGRGAGAARRGWGAGRQPAGDG